MKLIASPHFPEKRIGYLGMLLLLSEEADVLMLATNSLKNDMNSDNRFVAGMAILTIGNLATSDMSRDLAPEVDKHLKSSSPYLRKKACLAMCRCLTKCPDMVEDFVERFVTLLKDRSHGVLICVLQLMTQVLVVDQVNVEEDEDEEETESPARTAFLRLVPSLVKLLRNLLTTGYSPDHDVGGISDPFLQVQILTLFRILGTGDKEASEEMNDVLAQVATNTETSKNAGNAILYECVQTIMAIESEDSLRVLAVNILGRFLLNRDNNIRYVALNTLSRCIVENNIEEEDGEDGDEDGANSAASALQRHRTTVVDCLKDPDISIRQRALELIYHLVNSENVETLTAELLNYLVLCPREHRAEICIRVLRVVDRFSPNDRWRVDTLITMLTIAGRECARQVQSSAIVYISRSSEDLRAYATHKLLKAVRDDDGSQRGLLVVGIWCIGEYGDLLLKPYTYTPPSSTGNLAEMADAQAAGLGEEPVTISFMGLEPSAVVITVEDVTKGPTCPAEVKETALTCFAKLSDRFAPAADSETLSRLHELVKVHGASHSLELQLRSCEYDALLNAVKGISVSVSSSGNSDDMLGVSEGGGAVSGEVQAAAKEALARMPVVDLKLMQRKRAPDLRDSFMGDENGEGSAPAALASPMAAKKSGGGDLLDLEDIFSGGAAIPPAAAPTAAAIVSAPAPAGDVDLLADIFSAPPASAPAPAAAAPMPGAGGFDPFAATAASVPVPVVAAPSPIGDIFGAQPLAASPATLAGGLGSLSAPTPAAAATSGSSENAPVIVQALSHGGMTVEFECTKPDLWNKQNSELTARFKNTTNEPIYGLNFQVAVPKFVTMEMKSPTSTTVPPFAAGSNAKAVTQSIKVTNTKFGDKSLMLKLKIGFTSKGTKVEHMATCSGFPPGQF